MIRLSGLDRAKVMATATQKAHLWPDGGLCGADVVARAYLPIGQWAVLKPRQRCRRCEALWGRAQAMAAEVVAGGPSR